MIAGSFGYIGHGLKAAVSQVARAASRDEARPILTGVLLEIDREGLTLVATDSYRLAVRELTATAEGEGRALVPERALTEAGRAASSDEKGQLELYVEASQVASITVTRAREVGARRATRSPGSTPRAWSAPAAARASS